MANGYFDTKGLFGTTPEELQRKIFDESQLRRAKEMQFLASGTTAPGYTYGMLQSLEPLRQQFANTGEDPRVTQLREKEAAAKEALGGLKFGDPEEMTKAAERLSAMGLPQDALRLLTLASTMSGKKKGTAEMQNINFFAKNNYGVDLEDQTLPLEKRQEIINAYYAKEQTGAGTEKFLEALGTERAKDVSKEMTLVKKAPDQIEKLDKTLDMLYTGQGYTGVYADIQTNLSRLFGMTPDQKAKVSETQVLEALLGSDVFGQINALGIGARGLDTIPEREYLQKVITGEIKMDRDALIKLTEIRREAQEKIIDRWNEKVDKPKGFWKAAKGAGVLDKYEYKPYAKPTITPSVNPEIVANLSEQNKTVVSRIQEILAKEPDRFDEAMMLWEKQTGGKVPFPFVKKSFK